MLCDTAVPLTQHLNITSGGEVLTGIPVGVYSPFLQILTLIYIDLARAKSDASVSILTIKAIKLKLITSLSQKRKSSYPCSLNFRSLRHQFTF